MALVQTSELKKIFRMGRVEVHALAGIDLEVEQGEFIAVMGRSGSGKSTLLNMIGCLDRPTSGRVTLDGLDVSRLKASELPRVRREKIGFVFQHFNLIPTLTALENVMLPLRYAGLPSRKAKEMARLALGWVGLVERESHRPSELSGGEQQRVAIARALVNSPAVVLADEPTGELDSHTALDIVQMMQNLNRTQGQTFVIVTHDPMVASKTERVIRLEDGRILSDTRQTASRVD